MKTIDEVMRRLEERAADPDWQAEQEALIAERKARVERQLRLCQRELVDRLDLPPAAVELAMGADLTQTRALKALEEAAASKVVVLSGAPGCGKTVAAVAWLVSEIQNPARWQGDGMWTFIGRPPMFVTAARLARYPRYDDEAMARLLRAGRLVVDDMGVEFMDERGSYSALLDELVNERYARRLSTVLTTNLDGAAFKARYGERIADRIREAGKFVSLSDASMRRKP